VQAAQGKGGEETEHGNKEAVEMRGHKRLGIFRIEVETRFIRAESEVVIQSIHRDKSKRTKEKALFVKSKKKKRQTKMETQCASVDALQERLLRLEAIIYGAQGPKSTASASVLPSETVLSKINSLQQGLHRLENTAPHLHDFYPKCTPAPLHNDYI
jgi:hypothetical protein